MVGILAVVGFAVAMAGLRHVIRRMEREGNFDPQAPSSAAAPGLRRFFDCSASGFKRDGIRQLPPRR